MNTNFPFLEHQLVWIEDLKTTSAPQTTGNLFRKVARVEARCTRPAGYCCLGRICVLENLLDERSEPGSELACYDGKTGSLPPSAVEKYKLRSELGKLKVAVETNGEVCVDLADLNDRGGWTFKQIGEYIEANPEYVFTNLEG